MWKNSWFQLAALAVLFSGGLLVSDLAKTSWHWPGFSIFASRTTTTGDDWVNSLGLVFKSVPGLNNVLFCSTDTRVKDFALFALATHFPASNTTDVSDPILVPRAQYNWQHPGFEQSDECPVVGVNWNDVNAFCDWLTQKEQAAGVLRANQKYRLPTDAEWSTAAGNTLYPWGDPWPPLANSGNYAGAESQLEENLTGFNDSFARTSPVKSFPPNSYGLYDMGGNVWQWCSDWFTRAMNANNADSLSAGGGDDGGGQKYKVMRGGCWWCYLPAYMQTSYRAPTNPERRTDGFGFRLVLETTP